MVTLDLLTKVLRHGSYIGQLGEELGLFQFDQSLLLVELGVHLIANIGLGTASRIVVLLTSESHVYLPQSELKESLINNFAELVI